MSEKEMIIVPPAKECFVGKMYRLFAYSEREHGLRLNYIESIYDDETAIWRVEYRYNHAETHYKLAAFMDTLQQAIGQFDYTGIWQNTLGRIYIHVLPADQLQHHQSSSSLRVRSGSAKQRDMKRAQVFKTKVEELKQKAVSKGYKQEQVKDFVPIKEQKKEYEAYLKNHDKKVSQNKIVPVAFVTGETIHPSIPTLITSKSTQTGDVQSEVRPINLSSASEVIARSAASSEKRFAKGKLCDSRVFEKIRRYLAVFVCDEDYSYVDSSGESRLSLEMKISSEGFPLGDELKALYFEALKERNMSEEKIKNDLQGLKSYEQTSRIIRVQTAREKTKHWFEKTNRILDLVHQEYFELIEEVSANRVKPILIKDQLGLITTFA